MNIKKIPYYYHHPKEALMMMLSKNAHRFKDDRRYLNLKWRIVNFYGGERINWEHPTTFNEKLNWLKLNDRNPLYTDMADKYLAKAIASEKIGQEHVAHCYGVYDKAEEIPFDDLPEQFVLKCTHDSGSMVICKDRRKLDKGEIIRKLNKALQTEYFFKSREWPYKNIRRRIIAEEYLDDHSGTELRDYKFWCFNGEPKVVYLTNKGTDIYENFYDLNFNPLDISHGFRRHIPEFEKPKELEQMCQMAARLSEGIPFVRVDFFDVEGQVYFAEYTFYDWGGFMPFTDKSWDIRLGSWIRLQ